MRRSSLPKCTAWVRRLAPNLSKTRLSPYGVFAHEELFRRSPRLLRPWAMSSSISSSRGVMPRVSRLLSSGRKGSPVGMGTSFLTTRSCLQVSFRPSQMPPEPLGHSCCRAVFRVAIDGRRYSMDDSRTADVSPNKRLPGAVEIRAHVENDETSKKLANGSALGRASLEGSPVVQSHLMD